MPGVIIITCRDYEVDKFLNKMKKDNYLDVRLDLRQMEGRERYVKMKFWRKKPPVVKRGRPPLGQNKITS